jgi:hypothetical protein
LYNIKVSDGLRSTFMTLAGVGMMFYMSPELAAVGLGNLLSQGCVPLNDHLL